MAGVLTRRAASSSYSGGIEILVVGCGGNCAELEIELCADPPAPKSVSARHSSPGFCGSAEQRKRFADGSGKHLRGREASPEHHATHGAATPEGPRVHDGGDARVLR